MSIDNFIQYFKVISKLMTELYTVFMVKIITLSIIKNWNEI